MDEYRCEEDLSQSHFIDLNKMQSFVCVCFHLKFHLKYRIVFVMRNIRGKYLLFSNSFRRIPRCFFKELIDTEQVLQGQCSIYNM